MANQKDAAEKQLLAYNDVFADVINTLLFDGRPEVKPDELQAEATRSLFNSDGEFVEQERDVSKLWVRGGIKFVFLGIENQTAPDPDMALRALCYDSAAYRMQIDQHRKASRNNQAVEPTYPVVSIILYFGSEPWDKPKSILGSVGGRVPEELAPYVNDYRAHVFELAFLPKETADRFRSDMWHAVDYLRQKRIDRDYVPSKKTIEHFDALMALFSAFSRDSRFDEIVSFFSETEKEEMNMCEVLDRVEARGIALGEARGIALGEARGIALGEARGIQFGKLELAHQLVTDGSITKEKAAALMHCSVEEFERQLREHKLPPQ